jgi:PAS domain S-box-containing protein
MWVFDAETFQFLEVNEAAIHHYGYSYEEFLGRTVLSIGPREDAERVRKEVAGGLLSKDVIKKEVWKHLKKNGDTIFVEIASHNIDYMNRRAVLALANDVTERIRLEKELHEQRVLEQKQITEAVILAQERERTEIGKELHDNVNQILGATSLYINTAMTDDTIRQDLLERSIEFISNAINEIRKISKSLITPGIREIGLIESIDDIIEDVKMASSMKIDFDKKSFPEESVDDHRKLTIFRIIQEQLNNIIKHARASEVFISLGLEEESIRLVVADNGRGFDTTRHRKGVGITNIISRTELFNGQVEILSAPGKGCTLTVNLPLTTGTGSDFS